MTNIYLLGLLFIVLGTVVVVVVSREPLRKTWVYFLVVGAGILAIFPLALGMAFALYTFIPVLIALPIFIAWYMGEPRGHEHVRSIPRRYRRPA